jgi:hypothetical protein
MRKWIWIGLLAVLLGGGIWASRLIWRARNDLVSLDVINMPVEQVVESLRRQTGETILADTNLHARISLHLRNVRLSEALNRVGAQAGALAGTIHAIYFTSQSLDALKSALRHGQAVETAGWTNLAPIFDMPGPLLDPSSASESLAVREMPPGAVGRVTEDVQVMGPGGGEVRADSASKQGLKRHAGTPMMVMRFQKSGASGRTETEIWSPERIVAQSDLAHRLSGAFPSSPSRAEANTAASKLKAHCQTFYSLKGAPGGMAPGGMDKLTRAPVGQINLNGPTPEGGKHPPEDNVEAMIQREKLAQYQDLTPQQRVERLRQLKSGEDKKN